MTNKLGYVSLHNHTNYSILDSLIKPAQLFQKAKELGQTAIAVTDHGTLAAMWDSLKASKETGVKLIPGCEFYFVDDVAQKDITLRHIILLSKSEIGYRNLLLASAEGYDNFIISFKRSIPRIDWNILEKYKEGLICTTACANGILGQLINEKRFSEAFDQAKRLKDIFGDNLAIELQPHYLKRQETGYSNQVDQNLTNRKLREIAEKLDIKCIVATDAHYVDASQHDSHDVLLAIAAGSPVDSGNRQKYNVPDFYIKSEEEVTEKLKRQFILDSDGGEAFVTQCIENTKFFADQCEQPEWIDPIYSNPSGKELPEFPVKDQTDYLEFQEWDKAHPEIADKNEDARYLRFRCDKGLHCLVEEEKHQEYNNRLEEEFDVIEFHNFSSYMLIVMDYIEWAQNNGIPVGCGRGSACSSLIGYLTGIHKIDSIKYKLIFARFHNKEKKSFPDIDTDIGGSGRDRVLEYIKNKYGTDHVAQVSNFNTLTPKVYAKAMSRVFMYGGDRKVAVQIGNSIADSIPADIKNISQALEKASLFIEYSKEYKELGKYANDISNVNVSLSTHAGGIIIGKRSLRGLIPLRRDKEGAVVVEYEKERCELNGLVKMDVLGVTSLDIIDNVYNIIESTSKTPPAKYPDYNEYDQKTYDLISKGDTKCVFQLGESGGTIDLCRKVKPQCLEDIAIINALARPSAKAFRQKFVDIRDGREQFSLLHPNLERALKETLGFCLYEESLMIVGADICGWDGVKVDRLRKMTKDKGKNPGKVKKLKEEFIQDGIKNGLSEELATQIWTDVIEANSHYAFNHSHSIGYSGISFMTAYLKAHYPLPMLVANLQHEVKSNTPKAKDNILEIKEEIRKLGVKILPPDLNKSDMVYKIVGENTLITGLDALKNMNSDAMPEILAKRPFSSFEDFISRTEPSKVKAPSIQALAAVGCLDQFGLSRKLMFLYASDYRKKQQAWEKRKKKVGEFQYPWPDIGDWTVSEKCALERKWLGESLSGNKFEEYNGFFSRTAINFKNLPKLLPPPPEDMSEQDRKKYTAKVTMVQGEVKKMFSFTVKKEGSKIQGETMAKLVLEDPYGNNVNITCFPDGWTKLQKRVKELSDDKYKLEPGVGLYINGNLQWYEGEISVIFDDLAKFSPPPQLPSDLKAKKISMKVAKQPEVVVSQGEIDRTMLLDELEEELAVSGNSDLDEIEFDFED